MIVLGIFGFGMNPGACLLRDGQLIAFAEEERFTRIKCAPDLFPGRSVRFCLLQAATTLDEVDCIALAWDANKYPFRMLATLAKQYVKYRAVRSGKSSDSTLTSAVFNVLKYGPQRMREEIRLGLRAAGVNGRVPPIEFVPHHLGHSFSAYFCSPFREAIVLTLDGSGEDTCTQVAVGRGNRLDVANNIGVPHSLGWFYAAFTAYLGFVPYRDEGKLMALAGLGAHRARDNPWFERLDRVLRVADGTYEVDPRFTRLGEHTYAERFTDALAEWVTGFDPELTPLPPHARTHNETKSRYLQPNYVDLAWAVQAKLEQAALAVARDAGRRHGIRNLCIAGGVGLNCKMNGALRADGAYDALFVQPVSYDAGSAIGAAMYVAHAAGDDVHNPLQHAYYGPEWSNAEIAEVLTACKLRAVECDDIAERVARELSAGKLVGWFQGRMEMGARALGGRSILAAPHVEGVRDRINLEVKRRETWRPFGPSILAEFADQWLEPAGPSEFMTVACGVTPERRDAFAAVTHVDGTTRPQVVRAEANPKYHRMLREFERNNGLPFVINTSLNVQDEPILCTPLEALRCFYSTGLDALALGDFLLTKT